MVSVIFVCLGNICRSPMAEAVFRQMVEEVGLSDRIRVDSAGTAGWHAGEPAHSGTLSVLRRYGIAYDGRARQISREDLRADDVYLIAMDADNLDTLQRRFGRHPHLHRLLDFASEHSERDVPDPYYTGQFDYVYELVRDGCSGLLRHLQNELGA